MAYSVLYDIDTLEPILKIIFGVSLLTRFCQIDHFSALEKIVLTW